MNLQESYVCERLKKLGFRKENCLKLYGLKLAVLSDPILTDESAFVDVQDENSKQTRRCPHSAKHPQNGAEYARPSGIAVQRCTVDLCSSILAVNSLLGF